MLYVYSKLSYFCFAHILQLVVVMCEHQIILFMNFFTEKFVCSKTPKTMEKQITVFTLTWKYLAGFYV